jgi:hypothetical protein
LANYDKVYGTNTCQDHQLIPANTPVLAMLSSAGEIVHSDLTAIIIGPNGGAFNNDGSPDYQPNYAEPSRLQPFREFTIIYHSDFNTSQAFGPLANAMDAGSDAFGINYGIAGIFAEIWANRIGVGPMANCTECKFEEFFLSAWTVGDPAMVVDHPANLTPPVTATKAMYPDDPSNVYHSYLNDHVTFRILSADSDLHHIHHQHAHQWLHTPNSPDSTYLDSQAIGPGSAFTLEISYDGSGNRNKTIGDSIFHCHFYPHFAQGMWSLWRVHDVFEAGTVLDGPNGAAGCRFARSSRRRDPGRDCDSSNYSSAIAGHGAGAIPGFHQPGAGGFRHPRQSGSEWRECHGKSWLSIFHARNSRPTANQSASRHGQEPRFRPLHPRSFRSPVPRISGWGSPAESFRWGAVHPSDLQRIPHHLQLHERRE